MEEEQEKMMSLRARRKKSSVGIVCCFTGTTRHHRRASFDASSYSIPHPSPRTGWFKSRTNDLPEVKGKCRNFISRMARHRRHSSADFSYDPLSYALNFDDDASSADDEFRALSFSARLPAVASSTPNYDQNLPRSMPRLPEAAAEGSGSTDDLRRGFEALSVSMKKTSGVKETQRIRSNNKSSPRAAEVRKKSLHEADQEATSSPVGISSNREILVQLC